MAKSKWVAEVITLLIGITTPCITGRGRLCITFGSEHRISEKGNVGSFDFYCCQEHGEATSDGRTVRRSKSLWTYGLVKGLRLGWWLRMCWLHPRKPTNSSPVERTITIGNTSEPTHDFQGYVNFPGCNWWCIYCTWGSLWEELLFKLDIFKENRSSQ